MHAVRHNDLLTLTFSFVENRILGRVFASIIRNYKIKPGQLDPELTSVWYSIRGCQSAGMSVEETGEWLETLHGYKSANLQLLERWNKQLARNKGGQSRLEIKLDEAICLMTVLNDHRLLTAAKHNINQAEMEMHSLAAIDKLRPRQQGALYQIHFLAWIIEELLRLVSPDAANWMEK
jgi:hypothetical protein